MYESPWPMRLDGLVFREAVESDIAVLQSFRNDSGVNHFMVRTYVDPGDLRREWLAVPRSPTDYSCVVERNGQVVAMGFLDVVDGSGQPGHPTGTEGVIGYIVDPRAAGQGIGTATACALLRAAFDGLRLRRVTAAANADNVASVGVLERAGMRRERLALKALWHQELGWLDEVEYALLDEEWDARASPDPVLGSMEQVADERNSQDSVGSRAVRERCAPRPPLGEEVPVIDVTTSVEIARPVREVPVRAVRDPIRVDHRESVLPD